MSSQVVPGRWTRKQYAQFLAPIVGFVVLMLSVFGHAGVRFSSATADNGHGKYKFLEVQEDGSGRPVAYDPCRSIALQVNPDNGPPDGLSLILDALGRVEKATGLTFSYVGTTQLRPGRQTYGFGVGQAAPVLVSFAGPDEVRSLKGDIVGVGGSVSAVDQYGLRRYYTGRISLDAAAFRSFDSHGQTAEERAIILHEFGHLVGLDHVKDSSQLMNAHNLGLLDYRSGDLAGLSRLGHGPCA